MKKPSEAVWFLICGVGVFCLLEVLTFANDYIAPMLFDSRIERIHQTGLPKATLENGCVYCRMKADDFRLPLPLGYRALNPIITSGCFDSVDGTVELRVDSSNHVGQGEFTGWQPNNLQVGAQVTVDQIPGGMLVKFHYFGDK
jgi:hypothetical protein